MANLNFDFYPQNGMRILGWDHQENFLKVNFGFDSGVRHEEWPEILLHF